MPEAADGRVVIFAIATPDGHHYEIHADGMISGFPPNSVVFNQLYFALRTAYEQGRRGVPFSLKEFADQVNIATQEKTVPDRARALLSIPHRRGILIIGNPTLWASVGGPPREEIFVYADDDLPSPAA